MNNQATMEKMKEMKLHGMYRAFRETFEGSLHESLTPDELIAHLVDAEWDDRYNRKLERLLAREHHFAIGPGWKRSIILPAATLTKMPWPGLLLANGSARLKISSSPAQPVRGKAS